MKHFKMVKKNKNGRVVYTRETSMFVKVLICTLGLFIGFIAILAVIFTL